MPSQYKMKLHQRTLLRLVYVYVLALLGGSVGVLGAALIGRLSEGLDQEIRGPLIVFLAVTLVACYEGYRRQRLFVPKLWAAVLLAALVAAIMSSPLNKLGTASTDLVASIAVGLYVAAAMLALSIFDLPTRPKTVLYQIATALVLGMLLGYMALHLTGATIAPATIFLFGLGTAFSLATAFGLVPQYFEDASFCVIAAADPLCEAKFNNPDAGYWTMTSEQQQLTIVDGSVNAVTDPSMIWIPEALVPKLAIIRRNGDGFEILLHDDNADPARRGRVWLNGEPLSPGRPETLRRGDIIRVGTVDIEAEVAGLRRSSASRVAPGAVVVLLGFFTAIGQAHADQTGGNKRAADTIEWFMCNGAAESGGHFPVAEIRVSSDEIASMTRILSHITIREIPATGLPQVHHFSGTSNNGQRWQHDKPVFAVDSAAVTDVTELAKNTVKSVIALDISGSMAWLPGRDGLQAPHGESRWEVLYKKLFEQTQKRPNDDAAILPFECWHPKVEDIKELKFQKAAAAIVDYQQVSDIGKFKGPWQTQKFSGVTVPPLPDISKRDTRLFAAAVSIIDGLIERRQNGSNAFQFDLFTDGDNDTGKCFQSGAAALGGQNCVPDPQDITKLLCTNSPGAASPISPEPEGPTKCAQLLQSLTKAQKVGGIDVRFFLATGASQRGAPKGAEQSLQVCIEKQFPHAGCDKTAFPRVCLPNEISDPLVAYKKLVDEIQFPGKTVSFYVRPITQREDLSNTRFEVVFDEQPLPPLGPRRYGHPVKGDATVPGLPAVTVCSVLLGGGATLDSRPNPPALPWYFYATPAFFALVTVVLVLRAYRRQQVGKR